MSCMSWNCMAVLPFKRLPNSPIHPGTTHKNGSEPKIDPEPSPPNGSCHQEV
nr:MAG TPA: hypothetical protein [Caudoviricetes sp.]